MRTLYTALDASPSDSLSDLKKAYHRAVRKFHPDKNISSQSSARSTTSGADANTSVGATAFVELTKAWEILADEESRRRYDSWLREQQLREETSILFETVTVDEIVESWGVVAETESDGGSTVYVITCRCGGVYCFQKEDMVSYASDTLYIPCSNCSLVVKVNKVT